MQTDEDIWAGMDTTGGAAGGRSATPATTDLNEEPELELEAAADMQLDSNAGLLALPAPTEMQFEGVAYDVDQGANDSDSDSDAFMRRMLSFETFPAPEEILRTTPAVRDWIRQQLDANYGSYSQQHNATWLYMLGEAVPMDKQTLKLWQCARAFWEGVCEFAAVHKPAVKVPVSIFLRAIDLYIVCKAVALGLHELPVIDQFGQMEPASDDGECMPPRREYWQSFLPRFEEPFFIEGAIAAFIVDAWRRGVLEPFGLDIDKATRTMQHKIEALLEMNKPTNFATKLLIPTDMFSWHVAQHLQVRVAVILEQVLPHSVIPDVHGIIVGYTMDVATEVDFHIANAMNETTTGLGATSFIQSLHRVVCANAFVVPEFAVTPTKPEFAGLTDGFFGSLCVPRNQRMDRMCHVLELHSMLMKDLRCTYQLCIATRNRRPAFVKLAKMEIQRRQKWRRTLRRDANAGLNLITSYPPTRKQLHDDVLFVRMKIMTMGSMKERVQLHDFIIDRATFLAKRKDPLLKPFNLFAAADREMQCTTPEPIRRSPYGSPSSDSDYSPSSHSSSSNSDSDNQSGSAMQCGR